jgi:hypothetical protein
MFVLNRLVISTEQIWLKPRPRVKYTAKAAAVVVIIAENLKHFANRQFKYLNHPGGQRF